MLKKIICIALCCASMLSAAAVSASAAGFVPYLGYEYNTEDESVPAPVGFEPLKMFSGEDIGSGAMSAPADLCFYGGELYILDSGNSRILVTDADMQLKRIIGEITMGGEKLNYAEAAGFFICSDGTLLIADTKNQRIIEADNSGTGKKLLAKPDTPMLSDDLVYSVKKVIRDYNGVTYALVDGVNDGAVTYMPDGSFGGFYAINEVEKSAEVILNNIWKKFMTEEQIRNSATAAPSSITNFDIAEKGFIYTVTQSSEGESSVRLLNFKGSNLQNETEFGDLEWDRKIKDSVSTAFCDVDVDEEGYIYLLDSSRGRVFVYSESGHMISVFGRTGDQLGTFNSVTALETQNDRVYVLDNLRATVTVFTANDYIRTVKTAQNLLEDGKYSESTEYWEEVLKQNSNSTLAYYGIGLALDEAGEYREAMRYFRLSYSNKNYSDAFKEVRKEFIKSNFVWLLLLAIAAIAGVIVLAVFLKRRLGRKNAYERSALERKYIVPLFTSLHPSDGFGTLKLQKGWSVGLSFGILASMFLALTARWFLTGFSFNTERAIDYNIFITLLQAFGIICVCAIANWAVCTLIEGKGRLIDIFCMMCYSMLPFVISQFVYVILSNVMTLEEQAFLTVIELAGIIWSGILVFVGFMSIHQFSFSKNVLSVLITVFGIAVIIFLAIMFVGLMQQVVSFIKSIWSEIVIMS